MHFICCTTKKNEKKMIKQHMHMVFNCISMKFILNCSTSFYKNELLACKFKINLPASIFQSVQVCLNFQTIKYFQKKIIKKLCATKLNKISCFKTETNLYNYI